MLLPGFGRFAVLCCFLLTANPLHWKRHLSAHIIQNRTPYHKRRIRKNLIGTCGHLLDAPERPCYTAIDMMGLILALDAAWNDAVTLEFDKVVYQVSEMGRTLAAHESSNAQIAQSVWDRFMALNDNQAIWDQVMIAREHDAGFRGAAPMSEEGELVNQAHPLPATPERATILAADGSQVYPDPHGTSLYYLTNIAVFVYHHGLENALPEPITKPELFFRDEDIRELDGRIITNAAVNARRSIFEMQTLASEALLRAEQARPLLAIADGPLVFWLGKEVSDALKLMNDYHEALGLLEDVGAHLVGYVDQPRSRFLISTLYLMGLDESEINRPTLMTTGDMEGLDDRFLMRHLLAPGERSALMIQQSPQNKAFKDQSDSREIAFFYVNMAASYQEPYLARIEIPMWVAERPAAVDQLHALLYAQCQITDRYPYALTRADECAVVRGFEKAALDEMINVELYRNQLPVEKSQKLTMKGVSRYGRQQHDGV